MKEISVILPIHKLDDKYTEMLSNCLQSVEPFYNDVMLLIICPTDIKTKLKDFDFGQKLFVNVIENKTKKYDFVTQLNLGIDNCETEWFSILEIDDEYHKNWYKYFKEYANTYNDVDVFLPLTLDSNKNGEVVGFTNESVWAYGFSDQIGILDNETLLEYQTYQTSGGIYRTKKIKNLGKIKDNIKLTFMYEFLLRLTNNSVKIMIIPRVGYKHVNFREDSLFWLYKNNKSQLIDEHGAKFWLEVAKKEYFYKNKREI